MAVINLNDENVVKEAAISAAWGSHGGLRSQYEAKKPGRIKVRDKGKPTQVKYRQVRVDFGYIIDYQVNEDGTVYEVK